MSTPNPLFERSNAEFNKPSELFASLLAFTPVSMPVISLYLDARVNEHGRRDFLPFVKKEMTKRQKLFAEHSDERISIGNDLIRIERYLEEVEPSTQSLAIFACSGAGDYFQTGQFKAAFQRNHLLVDNRPHLYPLARLIDQYRRYAVVLADTNRARIFVFASARVSDERELANVKTKHIKVGGWSQSRYQRHEKNYHLHHIKEVIDKLERIVREEEIEQIILAGDEETVIPLLKEKMPKTLLEKTIEVLSLTINTPEHKILNESLKAFRLHDSLSDMAKVEHLLNEFRADNLAVAGVADTLAALSNGQVEEILVAASRAKIQFDPDEIARVLNTYSFDQGSPATLDKESIIEELVRRANQLSSARVTFIEDSSRLEQLGGVGALLRYRISVGSAAPYVDAEKVSRSKALAD